MLLDSRMPHMDGIQMMEWLDASIAEELVVLMLTSDDLKMNEPRVRKIKLDAHMVKPVRKLELLGAIQAAIDARHQPDSAVSQQSGAPAPSTMPATADERSLKILLAEDSADNRLLVAAFLRDPRYRLVEAEIGEIGLGKFKDEPFDLVLMDIQMPVMDGLAATRAIREWERLNRRQTVPVIALTAAAFGEDVEKSHGAGATLHMAKPIKKAALLAAIDNLTTDAGRSAQALPLDEQPSPLTAGVTADSALDGGRQRASEPVGWIDP